MPQVTEKEITSWLTKVIDRAAKRTQRREEVKRQLNSLLKEFVEECSGQIVIEDSYDSYILSRLPEFDDTAMIVRVPATAELCEKRSV